MRNKTAAQKIQPDLIWNDDEKIPLIPPVPVSEVDSIAA
jgi:hypothetical protein